MKKTLALILAVMMAFVMLTACQDTTAPLEDQTNVENPAEGTEAPAEGEEAPAEGTEAPVEAAASDLQYVLDKGTLVVGMTDYAPMNYYEDGVLTGFDTEFAQAVAEKLGVKAEFIEIEWDSKLLELDSKAIDCIWNGMTITNEVLNATNCSNPYVVNAQVVVMAKDKLDTYKTVEDLKDITFAAEAGSAGAAAIADAGYTATEVNAQTDALMEVASGAADACVIDITMANAMTGEGTSYADLGYAISLTEEEYGIAFRKDSDLTAKVNEIMADLIAEGTLPALAEKYELTLASALAAEEAPAEEAVEAPAEEVVADAEAEQAPAEEATEAPAEEAATEPEEAVAE